jgi:diguanylate cyclase (GGDEF)-like protein
MTTRETPDEIERHRLYAELEILFDTIRDLASTLSSDEVVERLIDRTLQHMDSEIASVLMTDSEGKLRIVHARGLPVEVIDEVRMQPGEGIAGHVVATGEPLLVSDVERDDRFSRPNKERYFTHSLVSAPLVLQGQVRGVINVNNKRNRAPYTNADMRLLQAIAGHAAVALSNARRYEEMESRAQRDALTNLANHGFFWSTLEAEVKRADRHGRQLALAMIDVDAFKAFNDRFGHPQGDSALVAVSNVIAKTSRAHDLAARYGGEEFAVILTETALQGAEVFAEKIRVGVESLSEHDLTVSVGVERLNPGDSAADLVERADEQLYRAKDLGRNRVCSRNQPVLPAR